MLEKHLCSHSEPLAIVMLEAERLPFHTNPRHFTSFLTGIGWSPKFGVDNKAWLQKTQISHFGWIENREVRLSEILQLNHRNSRPKQKQWHSILWHHYVRKLCCYTFINLFPGFSITAVSFNFEVYVCSCSVYFTPWVVTTTVAQSVHSTKPL